MASIALLCGSLAELVVEVEAILGVEEEVEERGGEEVIMTSREVGVTPPAEEDVANELRTSVVRSEEIWKLEGEIVDDR